MRSLFIVGAKILGLVVLYWGLSGIGQIPLYRVMLMGPAGGSWLGPLLAATVLYIGIIGLFAYYLLFHTERLADLVCLRPSPSPPTWPSQADLLRTGLLLIAVYFLLIAGPALVRDLGVLLAFLRTRRDETRLLLVAAHALQAGLALWIIRNPEGFGTLLTNWRAKPANPA